MQDGRVSLLSESSTEPNDDEEKRKSEQSLNTKQPHSSSMPHTKKGTRQFGVESTHVECVCGIRMWSAQKKRKGFRLGHSRTNIVSCAAVDVHAMPMSVVRFHLEWRHAHATRGKREQ